MPRVFVVDKVHPSGLALLRQRPGITVETLEAPTPATLLEGARAADGIVIRTSPLPGEAIAAASISRSSPAMASAMTMSISRR